LIAAAASARIRGSPPQLHRWFRDAACNARHDPVRHRARPALKRSPCHAHAHAQRPQRAAYAARASPTACRCRTRSRAPSGGFLPPSARHFREATYAAAAREGRRRRPRPPGRACGVEQVARRHRSGPSDTAASSRPVLTCLCGQGWRGRSGATRWPCPGAVTACPILYFSLV